MAKAQRAVVTGMGVVSPIGSGPEEFTESLLNGISGIRDVTQFDTIGLPNRRAAQVADSIVERNLDRDDILRYGDRYLQLALVAAGQALESAGLGANLGWSTSAAVCVGTCNGGLRTAEKLYRMLHHREEGDLDERMNLLFRYFALPRALATKFRIGGPNMVVTTACSSSTGALGLALDLVLSGRAELVLSGGSDALCYTTFAGFSALGAMAEKACTPFSNEPGLTLGEGAAFWVVESLELARARGVKIRGELLGYGLTADAYHPTAPEPRGMMACKAMRKAISCIGPENDNEPGYINAHGTGTDANDMSEARAIKRLLGPRAKNVPVSSTKSMIGHCLGAGGALEATASLLCMEQGKVPPTIGFDEPRPGLFGLDYVGGNRARKHDFTNFISNSFAFGGNNAVLFAGAYEKERQVSTGAKGRVVITGAGVTTPFGRGLEILANGIAREHGAVRIIDRFDTSESRYKAAGLVPRLDERRLAKRVNMKGFHPMSKYLALSCLEAMQDAGIRPSPSACADIGLVLGSLVGPSEERLMNSVWKQTASSVDIGGFASIVANSVSGEVSRALYLTGYNTVLSTGHHSGLSALIVAAQAIIQGRAGTLLAGGGDELFARYMANYDKVGYLPEPGFDPGEYGKIPLPGKKRILAEGAAAFMLEQEADALKRHVRPIAVIAGFGHTFEQGDFLSGTTQYQGIITAISKALDMAGLKARDIDLILTARQYNETDEREKEAIRQVFGHSFPVLDIVRKTGYSESVSVLWSLSAWFEKAERFNEPGRDEKRALVLGTSYYGNNLVLVVERFG
ncbi:MAG: hypothetical protein GXP49_11165 [Deltaproteobacteria bacterium]|nr:hypothetical protein [Deltaproteobacteria bacterium]